MRTLLLSAGIILLTSGFNLFSQVQVGGLKELQQQTQASFDEGDFRNALTGFRNLMKVEPGNAMYSYYTGRCLVELNQALDEAIELLYGASTRGVPRDVDYYLGMAYHRNYNFTDAQKYYARFELEGSRQELKDFNIKHLLATCRSGREITSAYNPYQVMNVTFIDLSDSLQYGQVKMKGGRLQQKSDDFFTENESVNGLTALMFMPPNPVRGDYIYYSGYARSGKGGAQLFRVKKGAGRSWGEPEEIQTLNSEGDEVIPYFDPIDNDLYFASDGRLGIGGFDLYRTHFDAERDQWSEPMNLGFPINSVMDEYLLLPGSDLGMVMFFSTRQGTDSTVTVYRVHLAEPKKKTVANDFLMLKDIANLGGVAADILAELEGLKEPADFKGTDQQVQVPVKAGEREITQVTILAEPGTKPVYQNTLAEALSHQALSDSLKDLASDARARVRESEDPNDRWVWQKQIMLWEKKAGDEEAIADKLYAQVESERGVQPRSSVVNPPESVQQNPPKTNQVNAPRTMQAKVPETIEVERVVNGLTVYKYSASATGTGGTSGSAPAVIESTPVQSPPLSSEPPSGQTGGSGLNMFDILDQSPYNDGNSIPIDETLPGGAYYRIQLGVFSAEVEPGAFGGISPVTGERLPDRGLIKYYAGKFSKYNDASNALSAVRANGYEDAFIVAWYNGNTVSTQKAKQLE